MTIPDSTVKAYLELCAKVRSDVYVVTLEETGKGLWEAFVEAPENVPLYYGKWGSHKKRCWTKRGAKRWAKRFVKHERTVRLDKLRDELHRRTTSTKETM